MYAGSGGGVRGTNLAARSAGRVPHGTLTDQQSNFNQRSGPGRHPSQHHEEPRHQNRSDSCRTRRSAGRTAQDGHQSVGRGLHRVQSDRTKRKPRASNPTKLVSYPAWVFRSKSSPWVKNRDTKLASVFSPAIDQFFQNFFLSAESADNLPENGCKLSSRPSLKKKLWKSVSVWLNSSLALCLNDVFDSRSIVLSNSDVIIIGGRKNLMCRIQQRLGSIPVIPRRPKW